MFRASDFDGVKTQEEMAKKANEIILKKAHKVSGFYATEGIILMSNWPREKAHTHEALIVEVKKYLEGGE